MSYTLKDDDDDILYEHLSNKLNYFVLTSRWYLTLNNIPVLLVLIMKVDLYGCTHHRTEALCTHVLRALRQAALQHDI
jgi:hypothetical protein